MQNMPRNKNQRREFTSKEIESADRVLTLQKDKSEYWQQAFLMKLSIWNLIKEGILTDYEVSFYLNELKNMEN
jgi:hypothetical protein